MGFRLLRIIGDVAALHLAFVLAFLIRFTGALPAFNFTGYVRLAPWLTVVLLVLGNLYGLHGREGLSRRELRPSVLVVTVLTGVSAAGLSFLVRSFSLPRTVLIIALPLFFLLSLAWHRLMVYLAVRSQEAPRVLALCDMGSARRIYAMTAAHSELAGAAVHCELPPDRASLQASLDTLKPTLLLVTEDVATDVRLAAVESGLAAGIQVCLVPGLYELSLHASRLSTIGDVPVLVLDWPDGDPVSRFAKRLFDLVVAAAGLVVAAPVMAVIALLILATDGGPVLFRQVRSGAGGVPFQVVKFRTMCVDAEAKTGPVLSSGEGDPRITPIGAFLRRSRLDELPQLWNVLAGDMSVVGPRPERPYFVDQFAETIPGYEYRLRIKPGLTGLAQVEGRYSTPPADKLRFDLLYARTSSLHTDLRIILKTVKTVIMGSKSL